MIPAWILGLSLIVLVLGASWGIRSQINGMIGTGDVVVGKPTVWWYVDDSQINSREWLDWGNRTTHEPNEPYLRICLARAKNLWGSEFTIVPIIGRAAAIQKLGSGIPTDAIPPALWMPWCRAAFLKSFGGLWVDGSVLPIASGTELRSRVANSGALTFGTDPDEGLSAAEQTDPAAGRAAGWAAVPHHPAWSGQERDLAALIHEGVQSWSAPEARRALRSLWDKHFSGVVRVDRKAEVSRDRYGRRLELDVLLGATEWTNGSLDGGLWVPLPDGRDQLERATHWLWFTRMSEEQIRESDFVWARWATKT
jgi:hypothetical protein